MFNKIFIFGFLIVFSLPWSKSFSQSSSWITLPNSPYTTWRYDDVTFINEKNGWVVWNNGFNPSNLGKIYKTSDGGNSWTQQFSLSGVYFRSIEFADSLNGWMGTLGNAFGSNQYELYYTTNGGVNWQPQTNIQNPFEGLCGISVVDKNNIFACGRVSVGSSRVAQFVKTTDGGMNWTYQDMSVYASKLIDCYFFNRDTGFVVGGGTSGSSNLILFTTNGGTDWIPRYSDVSGTICWKIFFVNRNVGYVSNDQYSDTLSFVKTTDGGSTWTKMKFSTTVGAAFQQGIGFINETTGWIGGGGYNFKTTNGGIDWQQDNFGMLVNRFLFLSDTIGYSVGQTVYKFTSETIGITQISVNVPDKFSLSQNYPNPFNPVTKIKFDLPSDVKSQTSDVKLIVYDAIGREVQTLVNERLSPGSYEVNFDGSNFSSGIYFYGLESENFRETKRMILLK